MQGFEPQLPVPETGVLPLDDTPTRTLVYHFVPDLSNAVSVLIESGWVDLKSAYQMTYPPASVDSVLVGEDQGFRELKQHTVEGAMH